MKTCNGVSFTFLVLVFGGVICLTNGRRDEHQPRHRKLTEVQRKELLQLWARYGPDYQAYRKTDIEFPCSPLPKSEVTPTSVHRLRPADIKVIGAMGDSLTAGTGIDALTILGDLIQYRGLTWSGGGQSNYEDQITVPNILKKYNKDVYGYATGNGDEDSRRSFFNVAVSGSTSDDLINQARELIDRMKRDPKVDVANDWKVVTILSGNNDLCEYCHDREKRNVKNFRKNLVSALDLLHAELPRTMVNLVEPLNVEILTELNKGLICILAHLYSCDCAAFPANAQAEEDLIFEADMYQVTVEELAKSGQYDTREDFTVVTQPFFNETYLPRRPDGQPDMSYFAPDCFHLSRRGQAAAASALWNNMVEPVGSKKTAWTPGEPIECPTEEQPFFYTNINSKKDHPRSDGRLQRRAHNPHTATTTLMSETEGSRSGASVTAVVIGSCVMVAMAAFIAFVVIVRRRRRFSYTRV